MGVCAHTVLESDHIVLKRSTPTDLLDEAKERGLDVYEALEGSPDCLAITNMGIKWTEGFEELLKQLLPHIDFSSYKRYTHYLLVEGTEIVAILYMENALYIVDCRVVADVDTFPPPLERIEQT